MKKEKAKSKADEPTAVMPADRAEELKAASADDTGPEELLSKEVVSKEASAPTLPPPPPKPEPKEEAPVAVAGPKRYRVKREQRVTLNGYQTIVSPDQIVSVVTHGVEGMEQLKVQGVELEEVK